MWLVVSLLLGLRIAQVCCRQYDVDFLSFASKLFNRSCAASLLPVIRQPKLEVALCCAAGAVVNQTSFIAYYTSKLRNDHVPSEASLSESNCTHWLAIDHQAGTVTMQSVTPTDIAWVMGWDTTSSTISLSTGDQRHDKSDERFTLPSGRSLSLPLELIQPGVAIDIGSERIKLRSSMSYINEDVSNIAVCATLSRALAVGQPTVVLQSDDGLEHTERSIAHWLDLCGLGATVIHTYSAHLWPIGNESARSADQSYCTVRYVSGIQPFCNLTHVQGHQCINTPIGQQPAVCIEDVLTYTARCGACESAHNDATQCLLDTASWQRCRIDHKPQRTAVQYLSSLGFPELFQTASQRGSPSSVRPDYGVAGFRDLRAVLRAFANAECADHLSVHMVRPAATTTMMTSTDQKQLT